MTAKLIYSVQIDNFLFETYNDYPDFKFNQVKQVHSGDVVDDNGCDEPFDEEVRCDGIRILNPGDVFVPPAIKTADCLPVGVFGQKGIAMLHAGWRGLEKRIIQNQQVQQLKPYHFIIGPHISAKNYEVGEEFHEIFSRSGALEKIDNKLTFSQKKEAIYQIQETYGNVPVTVSEHCTWDNEQLHSYRREKGSGRNVSLIKRL